MGITWLDSIGYFLLHLIPFNGYGWIVFFVMLKVIIYLITRVRKWKSKYNWAIGEADRNHAIATNWYKKALKLEAELAEVRKKLKEVKKSNKAQTINYHDCTLNINSAEAREVATGDIAVKEPGKITSDDRGQQPANTSEDGDKENTMTKMEKFKFALREIGWFRAFLMVLMIFTLGKMGQEAWSKVKPLV